VPDPDNPRKFLVCHNGKKTLSLGSEDAVLEHLAHGDTPGACNGDRSDKGKKGKQAKKKGKDDDDRFASKGKKWWSFRWFGRS
jgi:hypothetical protein